VDLLLRRDALVAEHHHMTIEMRAVDATEVGVGQRLREVEADHLGAQRRIERADLQRRVHRLPIVASSPPACSTGLDSLLRLNEDTRMRPPRLRLPLAAALLSLLCLHAASAFAADAALLDAGRRAEPAVIDTLKEMVVLESGSANTAGLAKMADYTERRLA